MRNAFLLVALFATSFVARAEQPAATQVKSTFELPKVEGWTMGKVYKPPITPDVSTTYDAKLSKLKEEPIPQLTAEVRIYRGEDGLAAGADLDGEPVQAELKRIDKQIVESPIDKDVKQVKREKVSLGEKGPQAWRVTYTGTRGRDEQRTVVFLTMSEGNFVRVQVGERTKVVEAGDPELNALVRAIGKAVAK